MKVLVVKLLVCGLCKRDATKAPEDYFRAADSERGKQSVVEHMLDEHAEGFTDALLNSWENR